MFFSKNQSPRNAVNAARQRYSLTRCGAWFKRSGGFLECSDALRKFAQLKHPQLSHHSLVKGAATNTLHWWSGELTANYLAMQVALGFNTERDAGVAFFIVF